MLTLLLLLQATVPPTQRPAPLTRFLEQSIGLDAAQLAAVERGEPVAKVIEARDRRDVALFGIITVLVARDAYVQAARDFPTSLRTPNRTQLGIFSNPATESDVVAVRINSRDAAEMKDCKPGDCVVKLPATDMRRVREQVNWSAPMPELQAQLSAYARRRLVEYVTDYRARGDSAMAVYDDRGNLNVRSSEAFAAQLAESPYVYSNVPSLQQYLTNYPHGTLPNGATEIVFWSEEVLPRLRPILSVTHLVVYTPPELPGATVVAAKQIYANHYFEAAVDLTCAVDRGEGSGIYLLVLRRYRFDNLPGGILNIRGRAINALRDQLVLDLRRQQATGPSR
jgi:hypothetical protein